MSAAPATSKETEPRNVCAGPFGAVYDYYIERPRLARVVLGLMWGVDPRPFYESLADVGELEDGATILDVPCGGGVALRGLRPDQRACWIGVDSEPAMLRRAQKRAAGFPRIDAEFSEGDMTALTIEDQSVDLCLSYGGLHCIPNPEKALSEMARCLRPGGRLLGSTFLADGSRRQRTLLRMDDFGVTGSADELREWMLGCGFAEVRIDREDGLAVFSALRP